NLKAIRQAIRAKKLKAKISVVISDTHKKLADYQVDYICLTGWKKIIPDFLIEKYPQRILNIHPGLIPDELTGKVINPDGTEALWNRGKYMDQAIKNFLNKKATYAGSTVHFLSKEFDFGTVLGRCFEKIIPGDTVESLYQRLKVKENQIYVQALIKLCQ
ncbi:MAG: formyltransferase family protein, partial [Patescibacteria group bacterium]|nr:formyltransferase family protein [Patescibacteria group bacterium]